MSYAHEIKIVDRPGRVCESIAALIAARRSAGVEPRRVAFPCLEWMACSSVPDTWRRVQVWHRAHARGHGVNPKAAWKTPDGWDTSSGSGGHGTIHREGREKGRKGYEPKSRQNASFSGAVRALVELRNKRTVWPIATEPFRGAHFATFPRALVKPCILAGCPAGGTVLDCFGGSGTTGEVAEYLGRSSILMELNPHYVAMARRRTAQGGLVLK